MKLSKLRDDRDFFTGKLSEIVRQLDFAGIAIIWIFRSGDGTGGISFSRFLLWPMGCLVLSLALDLLHYAWGSAVWDIIYRQYDKAAAEEDTEVRVSSKLNWPTRFFFWVKSLLAVVAFVLLLIYIWDKL